MMTANSFSCKQQNCLIVFNTHINPCRQDGLMWDEGQDEDDRFEGVGSSCRPDASALMFLLL